MRKFSKTRKENEEAINEMNRLVLWSNLGLIFLLAALSCLLFKYVQIFLPLFIISMSGLIMVFYWGVRGFLLSVALIVIVLTKLTFNEFELWNAFFSISIILSWLLLLLGRQEISFYFKNRIFKEQALEEKCIFLKKKIDQLQESLRLAESLQKKQQEIIFLRKQLEELNSQLSIEKQEKSIWQERHCTIIQEISGYQCKEKDFQEILKKLQAQLTNSYHMQVESKKNFQEKTMLLNQTRERVFYLENTLLALQKDYKEKELELDPQAHNFTAHIIQMQEINHDLELEIRLLEEVICSICSPRKKALRKKQSEASKEKSASILLQKKINELSANQQLSKSHSRLL